MADCVCVPTCLFFNDRMAHMPSMADIFKQRYCQGDSTDCARHMIYIRLGSGSVPTDLFPNEVERAVSFLENAG